MDELSAMLMLLLSVFVAPALLLAYCCLLYTSYVFMPQEIHQVLAPQEADRFCVDYDIGSNHFEGKSIPNLLHTEQTPQTSRQTLERLYLYRLHRTRLHKDDKILTAWNGLMIGALAKAGRAMEPVSYTHLDVYKRQG